MLEIADTGKSLKEREKDGTGLRLRSCRAVVDLHGGSKLVVHTHTRPLNSTTQCRSYMLYHSHPTLC